MLVSFSAWEPSAFFSHSLPLLSFSLPALLLEAGIHPYKSQIIRSKT